MQQVRILIIDDHPVFRYGLRTLLLNEAWVDEVAEVSTMTEGTRRAMSNQFDIVTMDPMLGDGAGIDAISSILQASPSTRVLVLTMAEDDELVTRAVRAGAVGVVSRIEEPEVIIDALRTIVRGGIVFGPSVGPAMLNTLRRKSAELPAPFDKLTGREREILTQLASGRSNAQIARQLAVSEKTVRNLLSNVLTKIGVADRVQAALAARKAGLATAPRE